MQMNSRLRELAIQAHDLALAEIVKHHRHATLDLGWNDYADLFNTRYAQLIIKDSIIVGRRAFANDTRPFRSFPGEKIQEHFGVEE